jgi:myo-inositol-1-phosphate synthase
VKNINVAIVGIGNCAGSFIEGITYYSKSSSNDGLLFPVLGNYRPSNINIVAGFDVNKDKVNKPICNAIYASPNNFNRLGIKVELEGIVYRGPTLDGNPSHLAKLVDESDEKVVDVVKILKEFNVDVLVNLLPTGSVEATEYYGNCALEAGCAFINCIPTIYAQREDVQQKFKDKHLPLIGDDIKSQVGSTILHRAILNMLKDRGATITKSSQVNIGGNTDFLNFVYRAETKLVSKYKSLKMFISDNVPNHIGHHYDPTKSAFKKALFDIEAIVFAGSKVKISVQLESDDKPNSSGSVLDLIRIAMYEKEKGNGGVVMEACAYYTKSAPTQLEDRVAYDAVKKKWLS